MKNLEKTYDPKQFEDRIYRSWEESGDFVADAKSEKEPYTIVMPPPNVTGNLHLGHALNNAIQDLLVRWKRMNGYEVLWLPGTDHAAISTEAKVVEKIKSEGKTKDGIGREAFLEEAWAWTREYGGNIKHQLRRLGVSCDWSRERFTMDEGMSKAVRRVFRSLYDEGLIYRGDRIVNWCPNCVTAISDAEVEHEDEKGHLWYIRYPVIGTEEDVVIATTRPETMLGDLAVAVHPDDTRYTELVGKKIRLPLVNREIPIIADAYVDPSFGSGCVKITPSHDPNDFEVGARHDLGQCVVIDEQGRIKEGYAYSGMDRYEARKKILADLDAQGFLLREEEHEHAVGHCERCKTVIEPLLSKQWFVAMDALAKPTREAAESGKLTLIPEHFKKHYDHWLDEIHDWCISRQLWWGHRIPVWYCDDCGAEIVVEEGEPSTCPTCDSKNLHQDPDCLDTWFSSALWPFATLGWPEETEDYKKFYPTDLIVTGYDILFFWIIRMVFSALHQTGEVPFHHVYFTGLIRDEQGRKFSKSLGNGIDPLEVIEKYGADALRFTLYTGTSPGNDSRFYDQRVQANRNFANKLWNATRFVLMNVGEETDFSAPEPTRLEDRWIFSALERVKEQVARNLENYEVGLAAAALYEFTWFRFCDWYIEFTKPRLYGEDENEKKICRAMLLRVLNELIRLLHPFIPFITEEIWGYLPGTQGHVIAAPYPQADASKLFPREERGVEIIIDAITAVRNERAQRDIRPGKKSQLVLYAADEEVAELLKENAEKFERLADAASVEVCLEDPLLEDAVCLVREQVKIYMPLAGLIDYDEEIARLEKEIAHCRAEIQRAKGLLSNANFTDRAPAAVVEKERTKLTASEHMEEELCAAIADLRAKAENQH